MPRDSARSLRAAVIAVAALGALSLSVPASLWMTPGGTFSGLQPVHSVVQAHGFDGEGRQLASPARLRPGSSIEVVVTGFSPAELILLRRSASAATFSGGRADRQGVFRYRLTVPATMSGAQALTVIGSLSGAGGQPGSSSPTAVFRYVVGADQAG